MRYSNVGSSETYWKKELLVNRVTWSALHPKSQIIKIDMQRPLMSRIPEIFVFAQKFRLLLSCVIIATGFIIGNGGWYRTTPAREGSGFLYQYNVFTGKTWWLGKDNDTGEYVWVPIGMWKWRFGCFKNKASRLSGKNVTLEMVSLGYAWYYLKYSKDKALADAEKETREGKRRLWADKHPVPPWDWRRN